MHERLKRLEDDLNAVCLWKDDGVSCRPLGLCSIFTRSAERCIALQERDWAEQFCTTQLPEVAKARAEALEDATVTTATAEAAYTSRCITHGHGSAEATAALAVNVAADAFCTMTFVWATLWLNPSNQAYFQLFLHKPLAIMLIWPLGVPAIIAVPVPATMPWLAVRLGLLLAVVVLCVAVAWARVWNSRRRAGPILA